MSGTIFVGVNDTAPSLAATHWVLGRACETREDVVLAHVLSSSDSESVHLRDRAQAFLANQALALRSRAPGIRIATQLLCGDALEQLTSAAASAALLVIGTHKTGFVQGRIFGSKFMQLAATATTPLAVIPAAASRAGRAGIVVGVADRDSTLAPLQFAVAEARRRARGTADAQSVTLVHCWSLPDIPDELFTDHARRELLHSMLTDSLLNDARALAHGLAPDITVRIRSLRRPPAEGLVDAATTASLLVLGRTAPGNTGNTLLGATVHDVLLNLTTATVVVPPARGEDDRGHAHLR